MSLKSIAEILNEREVAYVVPGLDVEKIKSETGEQALLISLYFPRQTEGVGCIPINELTKTNTEYLRQTAISHIKKSSQTIP
jgi:hypothetical protein